MGPDGALDRWGSIRQATWSDVREAAVLGEWLEATPPTSSTFFGEKDTDSARIKMGNEARRTHQFYDAPKKAAR
jgi:hypothetical protein